MRNNPLRYLDPMGWSARQKNLQWYDKLALWTDERVQKAGDTIQPFVNSEASAATAATFLAFAEFGGGLLKTPSTLGHLGEGTGPFLSNPSLETAPGMLMDIATVASVMATVGSALPSARAPIIIKPQAAPISQTSSIPPPTETTQIIKYNPKANRYYDSATGRFTKVDWEKIAPNEGFVTKTPGTAQVGQIVDRYGHPEGTYLSPEGTPYAQRGIPEGITEYYKYKVVKSFNWTEGLTREVPEFNSPGEGMQYRTNESIKDLVSKGYLQEIE